MKVVTKLRLFGIVASVLLVIAGVTFYWRSVLVQDVTRKADIANKIVGDAFKSSILSADYVVGRTERAVTQWKLQQNILDMSAASYLAEKPDEQKAVGEIKKWLGTSLTHFDQLAAVAREHDASRSAVPSGEVEQRLIAQLSVDEQNIVTAATTLVKINNSQLIGIRQTTSLIFMITIALLGTLIILGYFLLVVSISKPIQQLEEGTRIIAEGNLDFKLDVDHRRDEFGALTASFNTMISKLRASFEELKNSELQLRSVYDQTTDILYYMTVEDSIYRFISVNQSFYKATGLREDQVIGKLVTEVIPEPSLSLVLGKYKEAIEGKKVVAWEEVTPYPTGTKYGDVTIAPIFDSNGKCMNLIGTVHDVTDRKKAEEGLRLSHEVIRAIGEAADFTDALSAMLRIVCVSTGWFYGETWVMDPVRGVLDLSPAWYAADKGFEKFKQLGEGSTFKIGEGLPGRVWLSKKAEWLPDVSVNGNIFPRAKFALTSGLKAGLGVPIIGDGQVLAVVIFFASVVREEEKGLIDVVISLGIQLGLVFQRKKAEEELKASNQQLRASNQQLDASTQQLRAANQQLVVTEKGLKERMRELEVFNKATVGRELKMVELKKEIEELRKPKK